MYLCDFYKHGLKNYNLNLPPKADTDFKYGNQISGS